MVVGRFIPVNPQRRWWCGGAGLLAAALLTGCSTFSQYPLGMEQTTLGPLRTGQATDYARTFRKRIQGRDKVLFAMEMGRTAQLAGHVEESRTAFEAAIAATTAQDDKATISASGAAAQTGALLVNDKAIPYQAPSCERTLVHHYQALNYLALGDLSGAGVEIRRANREQEEAQQRRAREIYRAQSTEGNGPPEGERDPALATVYAGLDELAGAVKHSFLNAATFYLSSVVWEMLEEPNDAYIDLKRALEIYPDNPHVQRDVIRLGKRLGMREDVADFVRRFPAAAETPPDGARAGKARLVVIYEEGLVPPKSEVALPYPLPSSGAIGMIALPTYATKAPPAMPLPVAVDGTELGRTAPICDLGALAARALEEKMPGILARQITRAIAKGAAAYAVDNHRHDARDHRRRSGPYRQEVVDADDLGVMLITLFNLFSEQADLRSWLTLPAHVHVFSGWVEPGARQVALGPAPNQPAWTGPVTFSEGKTTILVVSRIDLAVYSMIIMQP